MVKHTQTIRRRLLLKAFIRYNFCEKLHKSLHKKCPYSEFSAVDFIAFGLNPERYFVSFRIYYECEKIRTKKIPNADTF